MENDDLTLDIIESLMSNHGLEGGILDSACRVFPVLHERTGSRSLATRLLIKMIEKGMLKDPSEYEKNLEMMLNAYLKIALTVEKGSPKIYQREKDSTDAIWEMNG